MAASPAKRNVLIYRPVYIINQAMARKAADANDSRERMIEAAISLMRGSGLSGAGINEVVRESGAPKGSVYYFFPEGKLSLAAEALAVYTQRVCGFIDAALSSRKAPEEKGPRPVRRVRQARRGGRLPEELRRRRGQPRSRCGRRPVAARARWRVHPLGRLHRRAFRPRRREAYAIFREPRADVDRGRVRPLPCRAQQEALHRSGGVALGAGGGMNPSPAVSIRRRQTRRA
ncbi:MAG: TetR/AcrR family transcriptional regulator [Burkholderiaceae bacterium]|nr:TetR/AcrR family transcriptional regulator [Burkholderiaceae bacterium]